MSAPTPAAVRYAIKELTEEYDQTPEEYAAYRACPQTADLILADHIRAIAAEMRKESEEWYAASMKHGGNKAMTDHANDLEKFADKLEGKEP